MRSTAYLLTIDLALAAFLVLDVFYSYRTGRTRVRGTYITRAKQPERFQRKMYGNFAMLAFCAIVLIWVLAAPGSLH